MDAKEAYVREIETELRSADEAIEEQADKVDKIREDAIFQFENRLSELRSKRRLLEERLEELEQVGDQGWLRRKERVEQAREELDEAIRQATGVL